MSTFLPFQGQVKKILSNLRHYWELQRFPIKKLYFLIILPNEVNTSAVKKGLQCRYTATSEKFMVGVTKYVT